MKEQIQEVIDTLQTLVIQATYGNLTKLAGCIEMLANVRNNIPEEKQEEEQTEE